MLNFWWQTYQSPVSVQQVLNDWKEWQRLPSNAAWASLLATFCDQKIKQQVQVIWNARDQIFRTTWLSSNKQKFLKWVQINNNQRGVILHHTIITQFDSQRQKTLFCVTRWPYPTTSPWVVLIIIVIISINLQNAITLQIYSTALVQSSFLLYSTKDLTLTEQL